MNSALALDWRDVADFADGDGGGPGDCDLALFVLCLARHMFERGPLMQRAFEESLRLAVDEYYAVEDTEPEQLKADNDA